MQLWSLVCLVVVVRAGGAKATWSLHAESILRHERYRVRSVRLLCACTTVVDTATFEALELNSSISGCTLSAKRVYPGKRDSRKFYVEFDVLELHLSADWKCVERAGNDAVRIHFDQQLEFPCSTEKKKTEKKGRTTGRQEGRRKEKVFIRPIHYTPMSNTHRGLNCIPGML